MAWIIVGMAGLGALQGLQNQEKNKKAHEYRAEVLRYSPWTKMGDPGVQEAPGALEMGLKGAAMGSMIGGGFGGGTPTVPAGGTQVAATGVGDAGQLTQAAQVSGFDNPLEYQKWQLQNQARGGSGQLMFG